MGRRGADCVALYRAPPLCPPRSPPQLPKGAAAKKPVGLSPFSRYKARYFDGENASGAPFLHAIGVLFLVGYTIDCACSPAPPSALGSRLGAYFAPPGWLQVLTLTLALYQTTCTSSTTRSESRRRTARRGRRGLLVGWTPPS